VPRWCGGGDFYKGCGRVGLGRGAS
jgi:hypothetical protein